GQAQADIGDEPVLVGLAGDAESRGGHPDVAGDELVLAAAVREHDGEPPARVRGALPGDLGLERDRLDHGPGERLAVGARDGPRDDVGRGADLRRRPARGNGHHQETQTPDQRSSGSHARVSFGEGILVYAGSRVDADGPARRLLAPRGVSPAAYGRSICTRSSCSAKANRPYDA